jgi:ketopantoate reductase
MLMKILVYGAGVIGTTYGWQLAEAGQDVTLLVRSGKKASYQDGIQISCRDERSKPARQTDTLFCPSMMSTMLGEIDGRKTPRLEQVAAIFQAAGLKPEISADILSWLKFHYIENLGATGATLKAGSAKAFADRADLVRESILATREALAVCQARGISMKAAPFNLRLFSLPLGWITWLGQKQYQAENIQRFFDENIRNGLEEIATQYQDVVSEGRRLSVPMPVLSSLAPYFKPR